MYKLWTIALVTMLTACASNNRGKFVSTPVPDEITSIIYSSETRAGKRTWRLTNDNLRIRQTNKSSNGKIISDQTRILKSNDYNWVAYSLEQANFLKAKSVPVRRTSRANEVLTIITLGDTYSYTQNGTTQFPSGYQNIVDVIPALFGN
jgi:hypothetical protein